ncbi:MAG TPA: hypothetical protein VIZ70_01405 [Propionibacteriaceae bacterium]
MPVASDNGWNMKLPRVVDFRTPGDEERWSHRSHVERAPRFRDDLEAIHLRDVSSDWL